MPDDDQMQLEGCNSMLRPQEGLIGSMTPGGDTQSEGINTVLTPSERTYEFEGHTIRLGVLASGEQGWMVKDLAHALGQHARSLHERVRQLPDDQQGIITVLTPGGRQRCKAITSAGLTQLLMRTDSPRATQFRAMLAGAGGSIVQTGEYRAPELPPEQPSPSTAIAPVNDAPSLDTLARMAETQLGIVRQMQQMRSDLHQEMTSYVDLMIDQRSCGLREEMDGLRQNYSIVRDLVDEAGVERLIESVVGQMIDRQVSESTSELRHKIGELLEDVGVLQQRVAPPPGKSKLDQVRHTIDAYCRHSGASHRGVYATLYREFAARYRVDLSRRAKNADTSVLQFVAARDRDERTATMMLNLAHELFGYPPMIPTLPSDEEFEEFEARYRADSEVTDRIAGEIERDTTWH